MKKGDLLRDFILEIWYIKCLRSVRHTVTLPGIRDWGHGFWVHRVDKFGRRSEARGGTMSGGQKKGGTADREAVPRLVYVEL
jgi:hypothetical protein